MLLPEITKNITMKCIKEDKHIGDNNQMDIPHSIPNREVQFLYADGTVFLRKSKSLLYG